MTFPVRNTTYKYVPLASDFESDSSEPPLSKGGIAGVVIAGFVVLVAITIFVFFYCRYYGRVRELTSKHIKLNIYLKFIIILGVSESGYRVITTRRQE